MRDGVSKVELQKAITKAETLKASDYTEDSWINAQHLLSADILPEARRIYDKKDATIEEIKTQIKNINEGIAKLKTVIDDNLDKAKASANNKISEKDYVVNYTEDTRNTLTDVLKMPENNDKEKTDKTSAINNAIKSLKLFLSELKGGLSFTDVKGEINNGKTMINLGEPSVSGNKFVYKISENDKPVGRPRVGTKLSEWTTITNGTIMTVEDKKYIGVAEIDSNGIVVQYSEAQAVSLLYQWASPACAVSMVKQNMATDFTGQTVKLVIEVDGDAPENIFYFDLSNTPANKYKDVKELAKAIEGAKNKDGKLITEVAKISGIIGYNEYMTVISKNETDSSSIKVRYEGSTEAVSKGISLIGYYNGETANGIGERN